jgi:hypothetical protein
MPAGRKKAGFDALKMRVEREARSALRKARPLYVAEFDSVLRATNGDFQRATKHAARYLHKPLQIWPEVLTALFDVEYVRIKVSDAFSLLDKATPEASDAGFWFRYHLDHWTFQMDAFLDRSDRFFRKFIRALVRPSRPQEWQAIERDLAKKVGGAPGRNRQHPQSASTRTRRRRFRAADRVGAGACGTISNDGLR